MENNTYLAGPSLDYIYLPPILGTIVKIGHPADPSTHKTSSIINHHHGRLHHSDRVILMGLQKAPHLNGKHGTIVSNLDPELLRYAVDPDICTLSSRINVKPTNLTTEPPPSHPLGDDRSKAENGILEEKYGRVISDVLEVVRFIAGRFFEGDPRVQDIADIDRMRSQGMMGLYRLNEFMAMAWTYWTDSGSHNVPKTIHDGVYGLLVDYIENQVPEAQPDSLQDPHYQIMARSIRTRAATGGWDTRIHADFWIVSDDPEGGGAYIIPDNNPHLVYKVLGVTNAMYPALQRQFPGEILKMSATLIPWFGRLVYDGTLAAATGGRPGPPPRASARLKEKLKQQVLESVEKGLVIERLAELEIDSICKDPVVIAPTPQHDPTAEEIKYLTKIKQFAPEPLLGDDDDQEKMFRVTWVFRRMGYNETENPGHVGVIMIGQRPYGPFHCASGLAPTSIDILKATAEACSATNPLPYILNIDDKACAERCKFLFKEFIPETRILYYPPPSAEEEKVRQF